MMRRLPDAVGGVLAAGGAVVGLMLLYVLWLCIVIGVPVAVVLAVASVFGVF